MSSTDLHATAERRRGSTLREPVDAALRQVELITALGAPLYRDELADGTTIGWAEVSRIEDRRLRQIVWHPHRRA